MAIKISGTTVIDDSRNLTNINAVNANGSLGTLGQVLTSNGTSIYWSTVGSVSGSNTEIQFNDSGSFGSETSFTYDKSTDTLEVGNTFLSSYITPQVQYAGFMKVNGRGVKSSYTIPANTGASMVGPVIVESGQTLTVGTGARFVVV